MSDKEAFDKELAKREMEAVEAWNKALREDEKLRLSAWKAVEEQVKAMVCDFPTLH